MTPQTVNAVNLPLQNAMNFPAAILQPPFFDPARRRRRELRRDRRVIGHEISHSFDDQGAQFDAQGRLANWWTPEDLAHFKAAGERAGGAVRRLQAVPGPGVNGQLTLSENIADVAGLAAAYDALSRCRSGQAAPAWTASRRPAVLPRLRAELARQVARGGAAAAGDRPTATRRTSTAPTPCATWTPGTRRST